MVRDAAFMEVGVGAAFRQGLIGEGEELVSEGLGAEIPATAEGGLERLAFDLVEPRRSGLFGTGTRPECVAGWVGREDFANR